MNYTERAKQLGFSAAAVMDTKNLVFKPEYRVFCEENRCGNYDRNPACPPESGSVEEMKEKALALAADETFPFEKMLKEPGIHYICEVKKASPSKGLIAEDFPYLQIAKEYEAAGADAISCLTEPKYFLGKKEYLKAITDEVSIPVLRKDFTVDEYQIYEAKTLGAGVVLLICALLDTEMIRSYIEICDRLGLSALVEVHDENEMDSAIKAGARVIGVNNRNLKDFTVDINNSIRLRELVDPKTVFVSESGIKGGEDMKALYKNGTDAVLIGELLMRAEDRKKKLAELRMETRKGC